MNPAGLDSLELENIGQVFYNLSFDELIEHELRNGECKMTSSGATTVDTGIFTGRSPKDKYFVDQEESNKYIAWGDVNQPIKGEIFQELLQVAKSEAGVRGITFPSSESAGMKTSVPMDSLTVVDALCVLDPIVGFKPKESIVQMGGYDSVEAALHNMIPKLERVWQRKKGSKE